MGLTLSQAQAWRPETVQAAAVGLKQKLGTLGETLDAAQTDTNKAAGTSGGAGEEARFNFTDRATAHGRLKHEQIGQLHQAVDEAGYGLIAKRGQLATAVEAATRDGVKVWNDGTVTGYDEAKIKQHAQAIGSALAELEKSDQDYARKIDDITSLIKDEQKDRSALGFVGGAKDSPLNLDSAAHNRAKAIADGTEPVPTDPKELHELWDKISQPEKDAIFSRHPDIGNYDGISCVDRDHYNRLHLDQIGGHVADVVKGQLYGERMLLYVDPQGHTAIATKNPDTAKNLVAA